jgi:hypothetical protein
MRFIDKFKNGSKTPIREKPPLAIKTFTRNGFRGKSVIPNLFHGNSKDDYVQIKDVAEISRLRMGISPPNRLKRRNI